MQISYQDWSDFLLRVGAICSPAELQGLMCGLLCHKPQVDWWPHALLCMDLVAEQDHQDIKMALEASWDLLNQTFNDDMFEFKWLLPDDSVSLNTRAEALSQWCQGFLLGLSHAGPTEITRLDEDTQEAIRDLVQISQLKSSCDDSEDNEQDLVELTEYVRVTLFSVAGHLRDVTQAAISPSSMPPPTHH